MAKEYRVGLVGVGAVGTEMIKVLKDRKFPCGKVQVFASRERDEQILGETYHVLPATEKSFDGLDIVLFAGKTDVALQLRDAVVKAGAKMIDNSRAFRQDPDVPLVVPQVNAEDLDWNKGVIANPNCTTAIMLEAVQGEGGVNPATEEFMAGVRALCDEKNLVMICDEVQCGMGRTGKWWGWQNFSVEPDLFTVAKSIADGIPMGALVSNAKYADVFTPGSHASTFGGNPVACAAALATIGLIEKYDLLSAAATKGEMLMAALQSFAEKYDQILDVRGLGLMLGMVTEGPAKDVVQAFADGGVLACTAGEHVVRLLPPLAMKDSDIEDAVDMMGDSLEELFGAAEEDEA